ncbi:DUF47 domain-containing protein [uncultured Mitsuokella sp.]|uniref:DUF47 domain-containing protein n=1 Tax=uncultured Mitsuokella sp. TaxID=453120 RepID=UPI00266FA4D3|nr:DUF47 family protein [uncultured Mitsuokella sp.]
MFSISNKHEEFFDYLMENAENFYSGALIAQEAMTDITKLPQHLDDIVNLEHKSDAINQDIIHKLSVIFITPIDREDFYRLTCHLEECIDCLQGALMRLNMYHIDSLISSAGKIMAQIVTMSEELKVLFSLLKNIDRNEAELMARADHLGKLESEVDHIYREEISDLFDGTKDLFDVIRWKDILGTLEDTADKVEELSNIIKEVTMKYA